MKEPKTLSDYISEWVQPKDRILSVTAVFNFDNQEIEITFEGSDPISEFHSFVFDTEPNSYTVTGITVKKAKYKVPEARYSIISFSLVQRGVTP